MISHLLLFWHALKERWQRFRCLSRGILSTNMKLFLKWADKWHKRYKFRPIIIPVLRESGKAEQNLGSWCWVWHSQGVMEVATVISKMTSRAGGGSGYKCGEVWLPRATQWPRILSFSFGSWVGLRSRERKLAGELVSVGRPKDQTLEKQIIYFLKWGVKLNRGIKKKNYKWLRNILRSVQHP